MKPYSLIGIAIALSGCAPWAIEKPQQVAVQRVECQYEVPVGSVIRKKVCRTASQTAAETARGRAAIESREQRQQTETLMNRGGGY